LAAKAARGAALLRAPSRARASTCAPLHKPRLAAADMGCMPDTCGRREPALAALDLFGEARRVSAVAGARGSAPAAGLRQAA